MSFGFGVGDFVTVINIAKTVVDACCTGPSEYQEIYREVKSLELTLESLEKDVKDPNSRLYKRGLPRALELKQIVENCKQTLQELQDMVNKHSSLQNKDGSKVSRVWHAYQVGSTDLDSLRGKLTFHNSVISLFLQSLQGTTMTRMEAKLEKIYRLMTQNRPGQAAFSSVSLLSTHTIADLCDSDCQELWQALRDDLEDAGIAPAHLTAYRDEILKYFRSLVEDGMQAPISSNTIYSPPQLSQAIDLDSVAMKLEMREDKPGDPMIDICVYFLNGRFNQKKASFLGLEVVYTNTEKQRMHSGTVNIQSDEFLPWTVHEISPTHRYGPRYFPDKSLNRHLYNSEEYHLASGKSSLDYARWNFQDPKRHQKLGEETLLRFGSFIKYSGSTLKFRVEVSTKGWALDPLTSPVGEGAPSLSLGPLASPSNFGKKVLLGKLEKGSETLDSSPLLTKGSLVMWTRDV